MAELPKNLRSQLLKVLHGRRDADADMDELNSVFLQVALALMLIFMLAFFLFVSKVHGEIDRIDQMKQRIAQAEQAELLTALERVAEQYRIRYGLKEFLSVDPVSGEKRYDFAGVIREGKLSRSGPARDSFVPGAAAAWQDFSNEDALDAAWTAQVVQLAPESAGKHSGALAQLVKDYRLRLRREVSEVQALAAAAIQEYFLRHPERVSDPEVRRALKQLEAEPDAPGRELRLRRLAALLRRSAYAHLTALCGVSMLEVSR